MRIAPALSVALALAACSDEEHSPPRAELPRAVLGVVWGEGDDSFVARLDPRSLEPLPGPRAPLGRAGGPSALSPDGSQVVFGGYRAIRVIDLEAMRVLADISERGDFGAVAWPEPRRILLATGFNWEIGVDAVMVDPLARRVLLRRSLGGSLQRFVPTDDGLLLLLGPRAGGIGPARLAVFSAADGSIRIRRLDGVPAGFAHEELEDGFVVDRYRIPGLAVDPSGGTAFVVGADDVVAELDLRTLQVAYPDLQQTTLCSAACETGSSPRQKPRVRATDSVGTPTGWERASSRCPAGTTMRPSVPRETRHRRAQPPALRSSTRRRGRSGCSRPMRRPHPSRVTCCSCTGVSGTQELGDGRFRRFDCL
ncbi:MAG: hypothetical protein ACRDOG_17745 [Gaiellaceae bacterium]